MQVRNIKYVLILFIFIFNIKNGNASVIKTHSIFNKHNLLCFDNGLPHSKNIDLNESINWANNQTKSETGSQFLCKKINPLTSIKLKKNKCVVLKKRYKINNKY